MAHGAFKDKRKIVVSKPIQNKKYDAHKISINIKGEIENLINHSGK